MSKSLALVLILLIAISCLMTVNQISAQVNTPALPAPKFTVKVLDNSQVVNGNYIQNKSVVLTIENQPFTPSYMNVNMYYNVSCKGHNANDWNYYYYYKDWKFGMFYFMTYFQAGNSANTVLVFDLDGNNGYYSGLTLGELPVDGQLDFQVQAYLAKFDMVPVPSRPGVVDSVFNVVGTSDWSNTQTINLANGSVSTSTSPNPTQSPTNTVASPTATPTPTVPEFSWLAILPLFIIVLSVAIELKVKYRKTSK